MKLAIQPVEGRADIFHFGVAVVVFTLAQSRASKVKPQHGVAKTVQCLHRVKYNFVMQCPAEKRMGMANQRGMRGIFRTHIKQGLKPASGAVEEQRADGIRLYAHFNHTE